LENEKKEVEKKKDELVDMKNKLDERENCLIFLFTLYSKLSFI
jgi:hypothetical protein